ncbi:MAG: DUF169 domain-containing protein [Actinobacteria bacterium]|nr:DUF169 domain-containing protein [Actinomycetota bacterium]MBU4403656.1 DUF169 domain-containing protein [Actinomycetota bacterium]MBU4441485.1 DUF169 domain-containing protein [Actinomycetota bacterium]
MEKITLELPLVGIKVLNDSVVGFENVDVYHGVSYCDAVRLAMFGEELLVKPGSIEVCKWAPAVLGLKIPENSFERGMLPRLDSVAGLYVAPLSRFLEDAPPDVVIVRGRPTQMKRVMEALGEGALQRTYYGEIGKTALGVVDRRFSLKVMLSYVSNRMMALLRRWKRFDDLIRTAMRTQVLTGALERVLKNTVADMSICRNSTVIPFEEGAGNVSFFCVGGISWGGNLPANMTSGFPYDLIEDIHDRLEYPGKRDLHPCPGMNPKA